MSLQLVVIAGPDKGRTFSLAEGQTLVIGRGQASDTQLNDPAMSRVHCRLQVDGGKPLLLDAGSSSGTFVNGKNVPSHELKPGEVFQVGDTKLRLQLENVHDASTLGGQPIAGQPRPAAPAAAAPLHELVGKSLAHFQLEKILAVGASGMVFLAQDTQKNRPAAVKVLTPNPSESEEQRDRFIRAMKTMLPIHHENLVELYNAGKQGPYLWAAMEYVDGESLTDVIERIGVAGMLDWREAFRVAVHVGRALEEAGKHKVVHRNVTPQNILQRKSDKLHKLGDLMLAKALEGAQARQITQPGQLIGDVPYMSPERTRAQAALDERSDLYGLGATVYALLSGKPPFESDSLPELVKMVREAVPANPKQVQLSIPDLFKDAVLKLLAKNPDDRYQSATQLLADLTRIGRYNGLEV